MKIIDIPQSGRLGTFISFNTPHGLVRRPYVVPRDPRTDKQLANRARWAAVVVRWHQLTEAQRCVWRAEASGVRSHGRLGDKGYLSGFQLFMKINTNLAHLGQPWADNPPSRPQFSDSPVGELAITHTAGVTALKLAVAAALKHLTLVWATAPASPGNSFPGRFIYLGVLPAPLAGASDITQQYLAVFGQPPVNTRVFIRTTQILDGWQGFPRHTTAVVPAA